MCLFESVLIIHLISNFVSFDWVLKMAEKISESQLLLQLDSNSKTDSYIIKNGFCVIMNIKYFDGHEDYTTHGSEKDVKNINKTFEFLNCKIKYYKEFDYHFTDKQVKNVIIKSIKSKEFNECDGFVLYIHTHGFENSFLTSNCQLILFNEIVDMFKTDNILHLNDGIQWEKDDLFYKNMPKIIIFDCCRG